MQTIVNIQYVLSKPIDAQWKSFSTLMLVHCVLVTIEIMSVQSILNNCIHLAGFFVTCHFVVVNVGMSRCGTQHSVVQCVAQSKTGKWRSFRSRISS